MRSVRPSSRWSRRNTGAVSQQAQPGDHSERSRAKQSTSRCSPSIRSQPCRVASRRKPADSAVRADAAFHGSTKRWRRGMARAPNACVPQGPQRVPGQSAAAGGFHQPVAHRGAPALYLVQPQADGADADGGIGLLRDHEREAVSIDGASVLALDEIPCRVVAVRPGDRGDRGDQRIGRGRPDQVEVGQAVGPQEHRRPRQSGDAQRRRQRREIEDAHRNGEVARHQVVRGVEIPLGLGQVRRSDHGSSAPRCDRPPR